jgi:hypothetical protein
MSKEKGKRKKEKGKTVAPEPSEPLIPVWPFAFCLLPFYFFHGQRFHRRFSFTVSTGRAFPSSGCGGAAGESTVPGGVAGRDSKVG